MPEAKRTLVKSGPELWAEVSDAAALARHLGPFGSVRITGAEPEHLLRWEGELARGTVCLEPSGFGTRVVLTAEAALLEPPPPPEPERVAVEPEPDAEPEPEPEPVMVDPEPEVPSVVVAEVPVKKPGFWARLFGRRKSEPLSAPEVTAPQPDAVASGPEAVAPEPEPIAPPEVEPLVIVPEPPAPEPAIADEAIVAVFTEMLDTLGAAHHRPFSRA